MHTCHDTNAIWQFRGKAGTVSNLCKFHCLKDINLTDKRDGEVRIRWLMKMTSAHAEWTVNRRLEMTDSSSDHTILPTQLH
jgi:hypothetical protein